MTNTQHYINIIEIVDGSMYKESYPEEYRVALMNCACNEFNLNSSKKHDISNILNNKDIGMFEKFCQFIDILTTDELFYLG